jgi:hypothetical protein
LSSVSRFNISQLIPPLDFFLGNLSSPIIIELDNLIGRAPISYLILSRGQDKMAKIIDITGAETDESKYYSWHSSENSIGNFIVSIEFSSDVSKWFRST